MTITAYPLTWPKEFPRAKQREAGALAATQRHLEDMRTLVFKERGHG